MWYLKTYIANFKKNQTNSVLGFFLLQFFSLLFLVCLNSSVSIADDNNNGLEEWHYTLRPGDTLPEISLTLLNHKYSWGDVVKHNRIDQLATLAPGSIIKIPMHWLRHQPKPAMVKELTGDALLKKASSSRYEILKTNMLIMVGDEVATKNGNIVIEFADGSTIRLEEHSNLVFNKLSHFGKTGMVDTRLRLKQGSLTTDIPPLVKGSRYEIKTPSAVAAVRGTVFRLHSTDKETKIEVIEGTVEFSGQHGKMLVDAGQGATISEGNSRIEVIKLPSPPRTQLAKETINELPAKVEWEKSRDASSYKIQLTEKDKNGKLVQSTKQKANSLEIEQIKNGDYELAIRSVNPAGFEGADAVSKLSVEINAIKVQLTSPINDAILDKSKLSFTWSYPSENTNNKSTKAPLSRLDIALDKDFAAIVSENDFVNTNKFTLSEPLIPGQYYWRVANLINNTELSFSENRVFNIKGSLAAVQILSVNYLDKQVGLFWSPVPYAEGYLLQVSAQQDFSNILKEEKLSKPRAHLLLNVGQKYYARVKGIGNELYSSSFGPIQEILIAPK
tara:strand:+ start:13972 stop:15648 length:1677 start_codon:yes stop_codon:yes gene_type:complete